MASLGEPVGPVGTESRCLSCEKLSLDREDLVSKLKGQEGNLKDIDSQGRECGRLPNHELFERRLEGYLKDAADLGSRSNREVKQNGGTDVASKGDIPVEIIRLNYKSPFQLRTGNMLRSRGAPDGAESEHSTPSASIPLLKRVELLEQKLALLDGKHSPKSEKGYSGPPTPSSVFSERSFKPARWLLEEAEEKGTLLERVAALEQKLQLLVNREVSSPPIRRNLIANLVIVPRNGAEEYAISKSTDGESRESASVDPHLRSPGPEDTERQGTSENKLDWASEKAQKTLQLGFPSVHTSKENTTSKPALNLPSVTDENAQQVGHGEHKFSDAAIDPKTGPLEPAAAYDKEESSSARSEILPRDETEKYVNLEDKFLQQPPLETQPESSDAAHQFEEKATSKKEPVLVSEISGDLEPTSGKANATLELRQPSLSPRVGNSANVLTGESGTQRKLAGFSSAELQCQLSEAAQLSCDERKELALQTMTRDLEFQATQKSKSEAAREETLEVSSAESKPMVDSNTGEDKGERYSTFDERPQDFSQPGAAQNAAQLPSIAVDGNVAQTVSSREADDTEKELPEVAPSSMARDLPVSTRESADATLELLASNIMTDSSPVSVDNGKKQAWLPEKNVYSKSTNTGPESELVVNEKSVSRDPIEFPSLRAGEQGLRAISTETSDGNSMSTSDTTAEEPSVKKFEGDSAAELTPPLPVGRQNEKSTKSGDSNRGFRRRIRPKKNWKKLSLKVKGCLC